MLYINGTLVDERCSDLLNRTDLQSCVQMVGCSVTHDDTAGCRANTYSSRAGKQGAPTLVGIALALLVLIGAVGAEANSNCTLATVSQKEFCTKYNCTTFINEMGECSMLVAYGDAIGMQAELGLSSESAMRVINTPVDCSHEVSGTSKACAEAAGCVMIYEPGVGCVADLTQVDNATMVEGRARQNVERYSTGSVGVNYQEFGEWEPKWAMHSTCYDLSWENGYHGHNWRATTRFRVVAWSWHDLYLEGSAQGRHQSWDHRNMMCDAAREMIGAAQRQERRTFWHSRDRHNVYFDTWMAPDYLQLIGWNRRDGMVSAPNEGIFRIYNTNTGQHPGCAAAHVIGQMVGLYNAYAGGVIGLLDWLNC